MQGAEMAKAVSADRPVVTEVPTAMQIGAQFTGGARRKYQSYLDFDTLRTFSVVYDVARACINYRKRQIANLEWNIVPADPKASPDKYKKQIQTLTDFFEEPTNGNDFKMFIDKIIEDLLVIDGAVLWKDRTFGGQLKELLVVDSSTIRMKISPDGTLPEAPEVAFQQIIYGEVKGEYTTEEMIYKMMNPRSNTPYGLGPLECLVIGVDSALRSQMYNANMLSEGSVPEGFLALPENWTADQIKDYQQWFDAILAGNFSQNTRIKMIPGGKGVGYMPTKKPEDMRMLEFEKWLLMKTCALFDVQPSAIGFIENLPQNPGEGQQELGNERGLVPMANFIKKMFTQIIKRDFNMPDLKFEWKGLQVTDDDFELRRSTMLIEHGALTINEMRVDQGLDPLEDPIADKPMVYSRSGVTPLEVIEAEAEAEIEQAKNPQDVQPTGPIAPLKPGEQAPADQAKMELEDMNKWEAKAINFIKKGKGVPDFKSIYIDRAVMTLIGARISVAKSRDEIVAAFKPFKDEAMERSLINRTLDLRSEISAHKRNRYERTGSSTG
jgi:phage portal protein BeeE